MQKIKISNLTLNGFQIVEFVKKMVYLGAHYSERQGLMGQFAKEMVFLNGHYSAIWGFMG